MPVMPCGASALRAGTPASVKAVLVQAGIVQVRFPRPAVLEVGDEGLHAASHAAAAARPAPAASAPLVD